MTKMQGAQPKHAENVAAFGASCRVASCVVSCRARWCQTVIMRLRNKTGVYVVEDWADFEQAGIEIGIEPQRDPAVDFTLTSHRCTSRKLPSLLLSPTIHIWTHVEMYVVGLCQDVFLLTFEICTCMHCIGGNCSELVVRRSKPETT